MTTLVSWTAHDQVGPSSLYVASDSRLSWGDHAHWDHGRKIFYSKKYPDILGFCGEAMFCSQILSQVMDYIDACNLFLITNKSDERFALVYDLIKRSFNVNNYPREFALDSFKIIYATRTGKRDFSTFLIEWSKDKNNVETWVARELEQPSSTGIIISCGSGAKYYDAHYGKSYKNSDIGGVSRSFFSALHTHIHNNEDPLTGGAIQITGLFNVGSAQAHGVVYENKRYIYGMEVSPHDNLNNVKWVNELFENYDGSKGKILEGAQRQPLPREIGGNSQAGFAPATSSLSGMRSN